MYAPPVHLRNLSSVDFALLQQRLVESANYAVLSRVAPVLRHDTAGLLQPVSILTTVMQRRLQMTDPDLAAINRDLASVNALMKEATVGCMNAVDWMVPNADTTVHLRGEVDEVATLLELEFATKGLKLINEISDGSAVAPQSFVRSVVVGAMLAFCDQHMAGSALQVTLEKETGPDATVKRLHLRMLPGDTPELPASMGTDRKFRSIDWSDIEILADAFHATMTRGEGWLILGLPEID